VRKNLILSCFVALSFLTACVETDQRVKNQKAFAKVYGYVKYFHPSDEASEIDWVKFSAFGAKEIDKCRSEEQVIRTLNKLFNPVAPTVKFTKSNENPNYDLKSLTPDKPSEFRQTYWQHNGVSIGMNLKQVYKSLRVNRIAGKEGEKIFDYQPEFGEIITKKISDHIYCQVPLVLYYNDKSTYPNANRNELNKLKKALNKFDFTREKLSCRLGNVINVYNVFQHFYPYFDVAKINWEDEFGKALSKSYRDKTPKDALVTLRKFTAPLKDGHCFVYCSNITSFIPAIAWGWIENQLVITNLNIADTNLEKGDVVTQINGMDPKNYFEEAYSLISAGTKSSLDYRANADCLAGDRGSILKITVNNKTIDLIRTETNYTPSKEKPRYRQIGDSIWYLNIDRIEMDTINKLLPALEKCKAIICDARGYPKGNHEFITHLMKSDDTTSSWMQIPQIVYPDQEKIAGYSKYNWIQTMKARKPYLGDKNVVYIIDGSAISYAESCLGYIEGYKLATIVGQSTAGTNGNVNPFNLPGGYTIPWTGMKVLKHNGSQHHGIGILPDIYVSKTIQGIKDGRDEFLEKAIEIANN
jgi:C-terminal processing protease CtpA/Prc